MRTLTIVATLVIATAATGCAQRFTVLTAPAVSMTHNAFPPGSSQQELSRVEASFCTSDDPLVSKDNNIGLIDEAVYKAQQESGADFLRDVTVMADNKCIHVEGMGVKVTSGAESAASTEPPSEEAGES